jgi:hypothetical protein
MRKRQRQLVGRRRIGDRTCSCRTWAARGYSAGYAASADSRLARGTGACSAVWASTSSVSRSSTTRASSLATCQELYKMGWTLCGTPRLPQGHSPGAVKTTPSYRSSWSRCPQRPTTKKCNIHAFGRRPQRSRFRRVAAGSVELVMPAQASREVVTPTQQGHILVVQLSRRAELEDGAETEAWLSGCSCKLRRAAVEIESASIIPIQNVSCGIFRPRRMQLAWQLALAELVQFNL